MQTDIRFVRCGASLKLVVLGSKSRDAQRRPNSWAASLVLAVTMFLLLGCASHGWWDATLDPGGKEFAGLVDSDRARLLLGELVARGSADSRLATLTSPAVSADLVQNPQPRWIPDQAWLRDRAHEVSMDFAALSFAHAIGADERSRAVQAAFDRSLRDGPARSRELLSRPGGFPFTVLFAPAWFYRSHPANGSDFARQRRLLDRLGIAHRLIKVAESGSVEDNAATIVEAVREAGRKEETVILVSVSKSGPEVALALSRLTPQEALPVAGWLNAAGALYGTPLADIALRPPGSWMARLVFWVAGWDRAGLMSMAPGTSRTRLEGVRLPDSIAVINLVAVPVSGSVGAKVVVGYKVLSREGPNDGVVLLADTVWPGGANIVALGADHLFASRQQEAHDMALLRAIRFAVRLHGPPAERGGSDALDRP
jgi:hypothetical protein